MNVEKYLQGFFPGTKGPTLDTMEILYGKIRSSRRKTKIYTYSMEQMENVVVQK